MSLGEREGGACRTAELVSVMPLQVIPRSQWAPDKGVTECSQCLDAFTMIRRKHHCRVCGGLFCSSCAHSDGITLHVNGVERNVRVCHGCLDADSKATSDERASARAAMATEMQSEDPDLCGDCFRPGRGMWKKRYLRLKNQSLNLHISESDKGVRDGSIQDVAGCTIEKRTEPFTFTKNRPAIVLKRSDFEDGEWVAAFDSEQVRDRFFDALAKIDGVKTGGGRAGRGGANAGGSKR